MKRANPCPTIFRWIRIRRSPLGPLFGDLEWLFSKVLKLVFAHELIRFISTAAGDAFQVIGSAWSLHLSGLGGRS